MSVEIEEHKRVKFYGAGDLAAHWHVERVTELVKQFKSTSPTNAVDAIELHNVSRYLDAGLLPQLENLADQIRALEGKVARFFSIVDSAGVHAIITAIPRTYYSDLLDLLGRSKAYERCEPEVMLKALAEVGIDIGHMLACKRLVKEYDSQVRSLIVDDARNAELLVQKYLRAERGTEVHLPSSFTALDSRNLLLRYIDHTDAHLNLLELVARADTTAQAGIDARLKLKAKRRSDQMREDLFAEHSGIKTGAEVHFSDTQVEASAADVDGAVIRHTYSTQWLDGTQDYPSILNNFQLLFEYADTQVLLTMPSYPTELGTLEGLLGAAGRRDYKKGVAFRVKDGSSMLQLHAYGRYLSQHGIELEDVIIWFFDEYLVHEFDASGFSYTPSMAGSSYLHRARHLFTEMEGIVNQFQLFVEDGVIDRDLLAVQSEPVSFESIPSLVPGKYVYATEDHDIREILDTLFSDQSALTYIDDELRASNAAELFATKMVKYEELHEYQQPLVDALVAHRVLENNGKHIRLTNAPQLVLLHSLHEKLAATHHYLSPKAQAQVGEFEGKNWVTRESTLLTHAESAYFNYFLNKSQFSNGPELRNKYLHGSHPAPEDEGAHVYAYMVALRLTIALVIKINDDFRQSFSAGS
ncbi:hypothetical protein [Demequina aurantiaca]|uniref:hypothetical protein n=1 Tax=Demequina aurantiaca TaxID=676200 RepID=UPI003D359A7A